MLLPKTISGGLSQSDLQSHNLDPSAHPPLDSRITQLENDIKYRILITQQNFNIGINDFISITIDNINDKHYEIMRSIPTLDVNNVTTKLIIRVNNPNSYTLTDFQIKTDISPYLNLFGNNFVAVRRLSDGVYVPSTLENNTNGELTAQFSL